MRGLIVLYYYYLGIIFSWFSDLLGYRREEMHIYKTNWGEVLLPSPQCFYPCSPDFISYRSVVSLRDVSCH